jgi:uncharacterized membrane protein
MDRMQVELVVLQPASGVGHEELIDRLLELDHEGIIELFNLTSLVKNPSGKLIMEEVSEAIEVETDLLKAMRVGGVTLYMSVLKTILTGALQNTTGEEEVFVMDIDLSNENLKDLTRQIPHGGKLLMALMQGSSLEALNANAAQHIAQLHRFALSVKVPAKGNDA